MKYATLTLLGLLLGIHSLQASITGLWGGKWDDCWPVFLEITAGDQPGQYKLTYIWAEYTDNNSYSTNTRTFEETDSYYHTGNLYFKLSENAGLLYGKFKHPRMANLVKIEGDLPHPDDADAVLEKNGWKAEAIPAEQAFTAITSPEPAATE